MESHRYDLELKSEDAVTPFVVKHPVTVQVQVRCLMSELHVVTPLAPLSETDWQCVQQLVTEAPAQRFCTADFRPLYCLVQALLQQQPRALRPVEPAASRPNSAQPMTRISEQPAAAADASPDDPLNLVAAAAESERLLDAEQLGMLQAEVFKLGDERTTKAQGEKHTAGWTGEVTVKMDFAADDTRVKIKFPNDTAAPGEAWAAAPVSAALLRLGFPDVEDGIVEDYEKSAGLPPGTFTKLQGELELAVRRFEQLKGQKWYSTTEQKLVLEANAARRALELKQKELEAGIKVREELRLHHEEEARRFTLINRDLLRRINELHARLAPPPPTPGGSKPSAAELLLALSAKNLPKAGALLAAGAPADATDADGRCALLLACEAGDADVAELLLSHRAAAHGAAPTGEGGTPLHAACDQLELELVSMLLEAGAKVDEPNRLGLSPLAALCEAEDAKAAVRDKEANDAAAKADAEAAAAAKAAGEDTVADAAADSPAKPPPKPSPKFMIADPKDPEAKAAAAGVSALVSALVHGGAAVDVTLSSGDALLHWCLLRGDQPSAAALVAAGADPHAAGGAEAASRGATPLEIALGAKPQLLEAATALCQHGARLSDPKGKVPDKGGKAAAEACVALLGAAAEGDLAGVTKALQAGAAANCRAEGGETPLLLACGNGHHALLAPLLQAGARLRVRSRTGASPLHAAIGASSLPVLRRLLGKLKGVDGSVSLDAQDGEGRTALHYAAAALDAPLATALLKAGASVGLVDSAGHTPLHALCALPIAPPASADADAAPAPATAAEEDVSVTAGGGAAPHSVRTIQVLAAHRLSSRTLDTAAGTRAPDLTLLATLLSHGARRYVPLSPAPPPLQLALQAGRRDLAAALLEKGMAEPATVQLAGGETGAHWAAARGDVKLLRAMLSAGFHAVLPDGNGATPLHVCSSPEAAELLAAHGASGEEVDAQGRDAKSCMKEAVRQALEAKLPHWAASHEAALLATAPAPPEAAAPEVMEGEAAEGVAAEGVAPAELTAESAAIAPAEAELKEPVSAEQQAAADEFRLEALTAEQKEAEEAVGKQVEAAAKAVVEAAKAYKAVFEALEKGVGEKIKQLLKKGAALAARYGAQQRTALHYAATKGDLKLVQAILELEGGVAGVTLMDAEGRSAAHLACAAEKGGVEVVRELVTKGKADLRLRDAAGCSVLQLLPSEAVRQELRALQPL
jgi:ankyrin repeat protein